MAHALLTKIVILAKQIVLALVILGVQWVAWVTDVLNWLLSWFV